MTKSDEDKYKFREANRASRKNTVRIAKDAAYEDLYAKLDSPEGIKMVYKLAKTTDRRSKDISGTPFINSLEGQILTVGSETIQRWLTYFDGLCHKKDLTDDSRWKAKSRQTKADMARPGESGYGQKPDVDRDGGRPKTLACHDPRRHTTKYRCG